MVASWKEEEVKRLSGAIKKAKVVGLAGITGIPSRQFQQMRKSLRGKVDVRVTRNRIIRRALKQAGTEDLNQYVTGEMGVLTTDELSPFQLERMLSESRTGAPAKPGQIAPTDIVIPAGDTPFPAGPVIGELQAAGIKARIDKGKIVVSEDSKLVSAGEPISVDVAGVLNRFGIEPFEIGLELFAVREDGIIYPADVLHIDDKETFANFASAHQQALNLAFNATIFTPETTQSFVSQAHWKALSLALAAKIPTKETIESLLAEAGASAATVKALISGEAPPAAEPAPAPDESKADESSESEKKEDDDKKGGGGEEGAAEGMAALFG